MQHYRDHEPNPARGLLAGLIGGLAGTVAMTVFQKGFSGTEHRYKEHKQDKQQATRGQEPRRSHIQIAAHPAAHLRHNGHGHGDHEEQQEPSTVRAAEMAAWKTRGHGLSERQKKIAEPAVHFGFGTLMGGVYGLLAEYVPAVTAGKGTVFGTGVMLGADDTVVPLLHLAKPPTQRSPEQHINSLTSHLVYGLTTEIVRGALGPRPIPERDWYDSDVESWTVGDEYDEDYDELALYEGAGGREFSDTYYDDGEDNLQMEQGEFNGFDELKADQTDSEQQREPETVLQTPTGTTASTQPGTQTGSTTTSSSQDKDKT